MANKAAAKKEPETEPVDGPVLDLTDADVKKLIRTAKKKGFVTYDQLNKVLPSDKVSSEQIEDIMAQLSAMGINLVEHEEDDEEGDASVASAPKTKAVAKKDPKTGKAVVKTNTGAAGDRTDDPVRMYLREMGTVELLSREGEIAIAKRIEAGRETMIRCLCESSLTFEAITVWRDELNEGRVLLRDIIDLAGSPARHDEAGSRRARPQRRGRKGRG